jgi:hypothetical protein
LNNYFIFHSKFVFFIKFLFWTFQYF